MESRTDHCDEVRIVASSDSRGMRLDQFLVGALARIGIERSRSAVQELIRSGAVILTAAGGKASYCISGGEEIVIRFPAEKVLGSPEPEAIPLSVLYEDEELIVVDKQPGLVVHPGAGNRDGTLVNALLYHCGGKLSTLAGEDRPGIVHRLDRETSGCLVAAKSDLAYQGLVAQFADRKTGKEYVAVVEGTPKNQQGCIVTQIGRHPVNRQRMAVLTPPAGKEAITDYQILRSDPEMGWSSLRCLIHTGRTHQIRVHCKEVLHCPILGDTIYAQSARQRVKMSRLMLHARFLNFRHPLSGATLHFEAPMPAEFAVFL